MTNLRRLATVILAAALVLSSMTVVFADDSSTVANTDRSVTLKDLGLYQGQDPNDPKVGLENAVNTQDSLIFLAKLFGYNDAANALTADQVTEALAKFDDAASISDYAKNIVAYSATNGILSGITDGSKFFVGAKDTVTAARFATFMLKQMGYTVADYKVSVAKLAETKGSKVDATLTGDLTRDDAVGVMYGALTAEKASGKTVIADIVGDNADLKKKAEKLGLMEASVTADVAVESVKALNCKQIEIVFNQEMDRYSVESARFYEIYDNGSSKAVELADNSASLDSDNKTVIITLNKNVADKLTNSSEAKVIIKRNIKAKSDERLAENAEFEKVVVEDGLLPTVTKVEATGEKNIRITFSEPVYDKDNDNSIATANFKVVSGTYQYFVQKATLDDNVINLVLGTKLVEGPVTVTVNNDGADKSYSIVDYAGYAVFKSSTTFDYVKDTSVSVVTVKSATKDKVVLNFSKLVKATNIKLYHTTKNNISTEAIATETDYTDEFTFTYDTKLKTGLPSGSVKLFLVNSSKDEEKLVDAYGVKVPDQTLTCEIVIDETPPAFSSGEFDDGDGIIELTFDEELDIENAEDTNNYEVKNVRDNTVISFSAKIHPRSGDTVTLIVDPKLLADNTEYQVTIKKVQDISGNKSEVPIVYNFTTGDNNPPEIIDNPNIYPHCSAIAQDGKIFIVYSEPMNESQMLDKANYMVYCGERWADMGENDKITKVNDRIVEIYIKELENKNDPTIKPSVKIAPIMDLANKRLYGKVDSCTVESIGADHIVTVKSAKENKVVLSFSRPVKGSNIKLYYSQKGNESYKAEVSKTDYTDEITFKFNRSLPVGKLKLFLVNSKTEDEKLVDRDGIYVPDQSLACEVEEIPTPTSAPAPQTPAPQTPTDTDAPVVNQIILNKNEGITIKFNERLNTATATNPENYVVKKASDSESEKVSLLASIDSSGKTVELEFGTLLEDFTDYQLVIKKYKDVYGNNNASEYIYPFTTLEYIYPEVITDPENDQHCFSVPEEGLIFITYSEAMNEEQMFNKENYQVSLDGGLTYKDLGDNDIIDGIDEQSEWGERTVKICFNEFRGTTDINPYVKIAPITDLAGNKLYDSDEPFIVEDIEPENFILNKQN